MLLGILAQWNNRSPVLALFQQKSEYSGKSYEVYPALEISQVLAKSYDGEHTFGVLRDYYREGWNAQGFGYAEVALATIFPIEPALYNEQGRRRTFPYLGANLIGQTISAVDQVRKGQSHLARPLVYDARDVL